MGVLKCENFNSALELAHNKILIGKPYFCNSDPALSQVGIRVILLVILNQKTKIL